MPLANGRHQADCQQHQGRDRVGFIIAKGPTGYGIRRTEHVDDSDRRRSGVSLNSPMKKLPSGGSIGGRACGRITWRHVANTGKPSERAASH